MDLSVQEKRESFHRYYLVSFNFMYTDFGKWFLGEKEKLVEENLVCAREIKIFPSMEYYLVSLLVILYIEILESSFLGKKKN